MIAIVLLVFVPFIVYIYNKSQPAQPELAAACSIPLNNEECGKSLIQTANEIGALYGKNLWHLIKSAVPLMLAAAVTSAVVVELLTLQAIELSGNCRSGRRDRAFADPNCA